MHWCIEYAVCCRVIFFSRILICGLYSVNLNIWITHWYLKFLFASLFLLRTTGSSGLQTVSAVYSLQYPAHISKICWFIHLQFDTVSTFSNAVVVLLLRMTVTGHSEYCSCIIHYWRTRKCESCLILILIFHFHPRTVFVLSVILPAGLYICFLCWQDLRSNRYFATWLLLHRD